jgi:hypothetical protein
MAHQELHSPSLYGQPTMQTAALQQQQQQIQQQQLQQQQQQPTVRVMRLYKPMMHVLSTLPPLVEAPHSSSPHHDFAISPFLLLPDSFGDIYTGELFSAYIAVVNGNQDSCFTQVTLSVRIQTANATHDLADCRMRPGGEPSGTARLLNPNDFVDVVVRHTLTELGTHTLRVSVTYHGRPGPPGQAPETKTLRKFYRFNVLQPLKIGATATDTGSQFLVQCAITNATKSPVFLEDVRGRPLQNSPLCACLFG